MTGHGRLVEEMERLSGIIGEQRRAIEREQIARNLAEKIQSELRDDLDAVEQVIFGNVEPRDIGEIIRAIADLQTFKALVKVLGDFAAEVKLPS